MRTILITLLAILLFAGCTSKNSTGDAVGLTTQESEKEYAISFTDDEGNIIQMKKPAEKIISLYSAHTENLYYLGAGDKIIGNYKTGTWPPAAAFLEMYDYSGDPETIIAAAPDAVIIRPFVTRKVPDFVAALKNAGVTVISLYPEKYEDFDEYINKLAAAVGKEDEAKKLLDKFHSEIDAIKAKTVNIEDKQTIFFESTETDVRTVTPDSMAGLAIEMAGGINIAADEQPIEEGSSIAPFGAEKVLMNADNIDVYVSQRGAMNSGASEQGIKERNGFNTVKAIKDDRFFTINEKIISSPTFRYTKGVREIARYLYPDIMDDVSAYENDEIATRRDYANILWNNLHLPIFVPSSSSYYQNEHNGHTFGLFSDIDWQDNDFDAIESSVEAGYIEGVKSDGKEYFYPEKNVTRDELAQTVFILGDFKTNDNNTVINDIDESEHKRIVQTLVDNNVFRLKDGNFEPKRAVTNREILDALSKVSL